MSFSKSTLSVSRSAAVASLLATCFPGFVFADEDEHPMVPLELFEVDGDLEVTVWAKSPMFFNPTNMDVDRDGRIWVAEGVNYRGHYNRKPEGDRIMILEDTDGDGQADSSQVFVQEEFLRAPLGIAVIDNKIVVSMTPDLVIYTDVNRDLKFDPEIDTREVLLTGFNGRSHDHSLHSVTVGPDGRWYWNAGNCGAEFTDKSGQTFRMGSAYDPGHNSHSTVRPREIAGKESDDGHVYIGGFAARMNPDGTEVSIIGHNFRNSYEQTVTSFGDVFQNDNDDPPACRTTFLLEYGNAGFASADGQRSWQADRRPGQSTEISEWRQEDPGTMPSGDVYGGGSPTGIAYYENGSLGDRYRGLLLSCEPARNVLFGYLPKPDGAGFALERFDMLNSNLTQEFAGTDFKGGRVSDEITTLFRPSDVVVGVDGAIYVADWYDPRVGGHQDLDDSLSGAIYRIAPKGFKPEIPQFDLETTEDQITALKSPAVNVRNLGFTRLQAQGDVAIPAVAELLKDENPYFRARAVWLLAQMGEAGKNRVKELLKSEDPQMRIAAFRALNREKLPILEIAAELANDPSPAVRREVALAMRDVPADQSMGILLDIAKGFDGEDRTYLEAFGTGATGKTEAVYETLLPLLGNDDSLEWSPAFAQLAWRLVPEKAIEAFEARAMSPTLSTSDRKAALTVIGFLPSREAAQAMIDVAANVDDGVVRAEAVWWLLNRKDTQWADHGIDEILKQRGIYDPDTIALVSVVTPPAVESKHASPEEILALEGDFERGKQLAVRCYICHKIDGTGIEFGPTLDDYGKAQTREVILQSMLNPSADISHGYDGEIIETHDGTIIHGRILSHEDPVIIQSMGGQTQTVPRSRIANQKRLPFSLMMTTGQLGLTDQDLADLVVYLKNL